MRIQPPVAKSDAFVSKNYAKPDWATGAVSPTDARFLYELISQEKPTNMLEVGVASGTSTVFISRSLTRFGNGKLHSYDALTYFYAKHDIPCGAFLDEAFPKRPDNVILNLGIASSDIPRALNGAEIFDLVFIDANHDHPWPCLDMIAAIAVTKPGSWVAHHDINLPFVMPDFPCFGPHYLFSTWPGERLVGRAPGSIPNIGAIKLFPTKEQSLEAVLRCLALRWDKTVAENSLALAEENIRRYAPAYAEEFRNVCKNAQAKSFTPINLVSMQNPNDWTVISGSPFSRNFVLHANKKDQPPVKIAVDVTPTGHYLTVPSIVRHKDGPPVTVDIRVFDSSRKELDSVSVSIDSPLPTPAVLKIPSVVGAVSVEFTIETASDKTNGAWVNIAPLRFV